ncbi:Ureidoglycolate hydrolase [Cordyceps fumosorosea ARSEF 2679]|uniref:Ureidoglycolate hydrolase n=1 Tax=Cordyceps fumosorosea (strain ARSEF 2679) TaxID=1081104 RepID=A0A168CID6_CORFA|nr:Ureidoglycolate hydrolase [Cordyceps fumosorosea ARSEF 2679]OAA71413.1 Ureidoglycolate hydrolase [Cordyceps fumosorosea ARSEF 2679]
MAARKIQVGHLDVRVTAEPLTPAAFAPFGDVVCNPRPDVLPSATASSRRAASAPLPANAVSANQGFAIQYRRVSRVANLYASSPAPSRHPGEPVTSLFVCAARPLHSSRTRQTAEFVVRHLERHPFTAQTFSPLASSASLYLVIVAPSLPPAVGDGTEEMAVAAPPGATPGRGLPNLKELRAFVGTRAQAVTYGAGTWHAPMVVLGAPGTTLDFVVSQFASGVADEDCQLLEFEAEGRPEPQLRVQIPVSNLPTMEKL